MPESPPELPPRPPGDAPANVLDSVFRPDGPMPPARFGLRALAFLLDFVLLLVFATFLVWQVVLPRTHPGSREELTNWAEALTDWIGAGGMEGDPPAPDRRLAEALAQARDIQILVFWLYFAAGEAFFGGASLGKRACRLRSVSTVTLGPLPFLTGIVRGGLKTLALFFAFPFALAAALLAGRFNKRGQLGHDLLSRTTVVDERTILMKNS